MKTKNPRIVEALRPLKEQLEAEKQAILARSAPLHAQRTALIEQLQPLEAQLRDVDARIHAIEQPKLREVGNELAAIARQEGSLTLSTAPAEA